MKLVYKSTGAEVSIGAVLKNGVEQAWVLESSQRPQHAASSGRIYVRSLEDPEYKRELFPHVLGLEFVEGSSEKLKRIELKLSQFDVYMTGIMHNLNRKVLESPEDKEVARAFLELDCLRDNYRNQFYELYEVEFKD